MLNIKVVSWSLGIFAAVSFIFCVVYGLIVPPSLHMSQALEAILPAFKWLTVSGFLLGLVESFLYGVYAGLVFVPVYNFLHRRWGMVSTRESGSVLPIGRDEPSHQRQAQVAFSRTALDHWIPGSP